MNAPEKALPPIGIQMKGGIFTGQIRVGNDVFNLITAPKTVGKFEGEWNGSYTSVEGAKSLCDGLTNTLAMAEAGSELAKQVLALDHDGCKDFYIPSADELELMYRAFKPSTDENSQYNRSGINVSAVPPTYPYTVDSPAQTQLEAFQADGTEAFEETWHWSSTQHAAHSDCAWIQNFEGGVQDYDNEYGTYVARAVRREFSHSVI